MAENESIIPMPRTGLMNMAEQFIDRAERGEKLTTDERRHAVAYIESMHPEVSNVDMARLFQVDEATIRSDIKKSKAAKIDRVREDTDIKLILADMIHARDRAVRKLAAVQAKMEREKKTDSPNYRKTIEAEVNMHLKIAAALSELGVLPKNIGTVTVNKSVFKAIVEQKTGAISEVRPLDLFNDLRDGETLEELLKRKSIEQRNAVIDAEFVTVPALLEGNNGDENENEASTATGEEGAPSSTEGE